MLGKPILSYLIVALSGLLVLQSCKTEELQAPNVILVITDDQGYGDLACHGNPWISTPNLDDLHSESFRFTDFHVGTTCAPTRSGLMTGKNCNRVGVWHTIIGRSLLKSDEYTMANLFSENGYATGMFGKWHLGDNYPFRPQDRGFDEVLCHGGGGMYQTPDYWNNDYFDDHYIHNGEWVFREGYCTDVYFAEALEFIENNSEEAFFCYIATNAPHSPFHIEENYVTPYEGNGSIPNPNFYGMITNIDDNMGLLEQKLEELGIRENTLLIFMTDNGTAAGVTLDSDQFKSKGYNAGMRGLKGSDYDGGHRVPLFLRWPEGGIEGGIDVKRITSYTDMLPTLAELCGLELPSGLDLDGTSLVPLIKGGDEDWPERIIITDTQREEHLIKGKNSAVMTDRWRLVRGTELYDMDNDPGQSKDVSALHPDVVERLNREYESWWNRVSAHPEMQAIIVGSGQENPVHITCHDWHPSDGRYPAWNQVLIRKGDHNNGIWALQVAEAGSYRLTLRRWPIESGYGLNEAVPAGGPIPGGTPYPEGELSTFTRAAIQAGESKMEAEIAADQKEVSFELDLKEGSLELRTRLIEADGNERGAYYVEILKL